MVFKSISPLLQEKSRKGFKIITKKKTNQEITAPSAGNTTNLLT